jgi:hypothetical protein
VLCVLVGLFALSVAPVRAAVTHKYLSQITEVPAGGGVAVPGPVAALDAMTVDAGHLWVAEHIEGTNGSRVDLFDAGSGVFVSQFPQPAGLTDTTRGIAVGHATGEGLVYVGAVDSGEAHQGRVGVFSEAGVLLGSWTGADTPGGSFGRGGVVGVAVDGSLGGPASGDVYVVDKFFGGDLLRFVDVFKPEAGGKEPLAGNVSQLTGTCPVEGTACEPAEVVLFNDPSHVAVDDSTGRVLVADYVLEEVEGHLVAHDVVDVFEPQLLGGYVFVRQISVPGTAGVGAAAGLAVDGGTGEIYVAITDLALNVAVGVPRGFVDQFSSSGVFLGQILGSDTPAGDLKGPSSVAVDPASHRVFVGDKREKSEPGVLPQASVLDVFGPDLVIPDVVTGPVTSVKPGSATLTGTVKLDKEGEASCRFVWGTTPEFGHVAPCSAPVTVEEGAVQASIGLAGGEVLEPDTTYYYRLQATNKNGTNPSEPSADQQFRTTGPGIHGESASNVAATSVTLNATIDPNNASTSYFFQYGTSSVYGTDVPAPPGLLLGSGVGDVETSPLHVQGLTAGTVYHFRVVAVSELEPGVFAMFEGPDRTFTTQAPGGFVLPDGRAWEMVSPPDKRGALIQPIKGFGLVQASVNGDAVSFVTDVPTEAEPSGYGFELNVFAWRGGDGWVSRDHTTPHRVAALGIGLETRFYSEDLSLEALQPLGPFEPSLSGEASEQTALVRTDYLHGSVTEPCVTACYTPFVTGKSGFANVPPGTIFGRSLVGEEGPCPPAPECGPRFISSTPDLKHVLLESHVALTSTPLEQGTHGLYEWSGGMLTPVSVLPGSSVVGDNDSTKVSFGRVMSDNGSRIVWVVNGHLYLRDTVKGETLQLDAVQGGPGGGVTEVTIQSFSTDGSKVFFEDVQQLTANSGGLPPSTNDEPDLYECEIVEAAGKLMCDLSDLTPPSAKERAFVQPEILGASKDGSYVYFVADGVFAPGAVPGTCRGSNIIAGAVCNVYVRHDGKTKLVAVLSSADHADFDFAPTAEPEQRTKVSADGRWLVFMSQQELTGYNTHDAITGKPDEEVYLYDAVSGRLVCASCNSTGARPIGKEGRNAPLVEGGSGVEQGLAANVPGWTPYTVNGHALYQSRYLTDNGRVFFNSSDGLVPQDVNGQEDVYQYEPPGVGDCTTASPTFSERSGGCISLISAGTSPEESAFLDASGTGSNVFFLTASKLSSQDFDTSLDVYDAHECEGTGSCFAPSPAQPPACSTGDACKPSPSVQPPIFGAPSSATFSGAGNVSQSGSGTLAKTKSLTKAQKLARALRACHQRKKGGKRRGACERQARARYAAKRSKTSTKIGRG